MTGIIQWAWHEAPREVLIAVVIGSAVTLTITGVTVVLHRARERAAARRHAFLAAHAKHQTMLVEEAHHQAVTGRTHPRVQERLDAGEHPTPELHRVAVAQ